MRFAIALVLILSMVGALASASQSPAMQAWHDACTMSRYSCEDLPRPVVVRAPLAEGRLGQYNQGDMYVLVSTAVRDPRLAEAVAVHEMVHYLQWRRGAWIPTQEGICTIEHEAFDVSNKVLDRRGAAKFHVEWNSVAEEYGCPNDPETVPDGKPQVQGP